MNLRILTGLPLLLSLNACGYYAANIDETDPGRILAPGSVVVLNQAIVVQPGYSRSFIQRGRAIRRDQLEQREPWCQFRLYEPPEALRTTRNIEADRFLVTESYRRVETFAQPHPAVQPPLASSRYILWPILDRDPDDQHLSNTMRIHSAAQPAVIEFKCTRLTEPAPHNRVSIRQMQQTLGDVVTLELKAVE